MDSDHNTKPDNELELKVAAEHLEESDDRTLPKEERRLLRKIDLYVLPWICITYALSQIDRTNISSAKIAGMATDLDLIGNRYSIVLLIFFIPYVCSELPTNTIIRRVGAKIVLTTMILGWGAIAMCFGFVNNYGQLAALRVLLGLFEGGFNPACIYIISSWYKRYETQQRLAIWYMFGATVSGFNGILSYGLTQMEGAGGLRGWRWVFIVPGAITIALALPIYLFVSEFPEKAAWLKPRELELVRERLMADRGEVLEDRVSKRSLISVMTNWRILSMALLFLFPSSSAYAMAFFIPTILQSLGYSVALSQILSTPPYIFAALVSITTGIYADRVRKRSPFIIGYCILVIVGLIMIGFGNNTGCKLAGIFLAVAGNNCCIPTVLAFLANNVASNSERQVAVPIQTIFAGLGGIVGSTIFREQDYPEYKPGLYATIGCMVLCITITGGLALFYRQENRKAEDEGKILEGMPGFRYTI